jgi:hypothetical protein
MAVQGGAGSIDRRLLRFELRFRGFPVNDRASNGALAALPVAGVRLIPPLGSRAGLGWLAAGP